MIGAIDRFNISRPSISAYKALSKPFLSSNLSCIAAVKCYSQMYRHECLSVARVNAVCGYLNNMDVFVKRVLGVNSERR